MYAIVGKELLCSKALNLTICNVGGTIIKVVIYPYRETYRYGYIFALRSDFGQNLHRAFRYPGTEKQILTAVPTDTQLRKAQHIYRMASGFTDGIDDILFVVLPCYRHLI